MVKKDPILEFLFNQINANRSNTTLSIIGQVLQTNNNILQVDTEAAKETLKVQVEEWIVDSSIEAAPAYQAFVSKALAMIANLSVMSGDLDGGREYFEQCRDKLSRHAQALAVLRRPCIQTKILLSKIDDCEEQILRKNKADWFWVD